MSNINKYYDLSRTAEMIQNKRHRDLVGGMWDEIGILQYEFLVSHGLMPDMRLIDIGCGCLRGGVHFVKYLMPNHYYGMDIADALLTVGYEEEITKLGLQDRLERNNLKCDHDFRFDLFDVDFDQAVAISLFTHLPLNHIRLCLKRLAMKMNSGGKFFATFFLVENDEWEEPVKHARGGVTTLPTEDPYHYTEEDLRYCVSGLPWSVEVVGDWAHPRDQKMVVFHKIAE